MSQQAIAVEATTGYVRATAGAVYEKVNHTVSVNAATARGVDSGKFKLSKGNTEKVWWEGVVTNVLYYTRQNVEVQGLTHAGEPVTIQFQFKDRAWHVAATIHGASGPLLELPLTKGYGSVSIFFA